MKKSAPTLNHVFKTIMACGLISFFGTLNAQTLAFPEAKGFGKETKGARGHASPRIYLVTNLNDSGAGSFRDAVSQSGRFVIFKVGGIIDLSSAVVVASNTTIAGQTSTGEGIVLLGKVSFSGSSNTIARYIRIRNNDTNKGQDASGISNGANIMLDHITFTWATDEVFSINWDNKGSSPDNITLQNCIIGQGLHRHNHSAGGLMQPSAGGKISLIGNLYISNKTRNNKVKGINEFVNNVVYNWGNYGNTYAHSESGDAYIMGGDSAGNSDVNIINNYFIGGPNTSSSVSTPFNRGNDNFYVYGKGNYFDNNKDGVLNGTLVPENLTGYPTGNAATILSTPYDYPMKTPTLTAQGAFDKIVLSVGASYPSRDQLDNLIISDLTSKGTVATYVYVPSDLTTQFGFINGGAGHVYGGTAPLDTDNDGMPDTWEDANGLNKNSADALTVSTTKAPYLNIEVYINGLVAETAPNIILPPSNATFTNHITTVTPTVSSLKVNWTDNATNENNYVVERSTNGTNFTVISTLGANATNYTDSGLTPNTQYYYRVKATNSTGSSTYNTITSTTTLPIPSLPSKATGAIPNHIATNVELATTLKWTAGTNTVSYAVYFGTSTSNMTKLADIAHSANPSYQLTGLVYGTKYYWRIDATNSNGTTTGDVWNFKTVALELVGHWPFQEAPFSGSTIADVTTYANNGVLNTTYDNASVRIAGKNNNALDLATSSNNMYIASIPSKDYLLFDQKSFTVSFWMKASPSLATTSMYLLCKGSITKNTTTNATGKRFNVEVKSGTLRFTIDDDITKREVTTSATPYFTGNWVNVVVMRNVVSHKIQIYTNGAFTAEVDESATTGIAEDSDLIIGNIGKLELVSGSTVTPSPYKGAIDELKIFNYALTAAEVTTLYNNTNSSSQKVLNTEKFSPNNTNITVHPNPVKDKVFITIPNYKEPSAIATLVDITGKTILKEQIVSDSNGQFTLDIATKTTSGIYILNVTGEDLNSTFKIVVE